MNQISIDDAEGKTVQHVLAGDRDYPGEKAVITLLFTDNTFCTLRPAARLVHGGAEPRITCYIVQGSPGKP